VSGSLLVRTGYRAISAGLRLPDWKRARDFRQQSRTIDEIKRRGINIVVDAGANKGFYSKHLRMMGYSGQILAFEPVRETFEELAAAAAGDPKWKVFNLALGREAGEIDFNVVKCDSGRETVLSSALTPLYASGEKSRVEVCRLDEILPSQAEADPARIFLKMDTQGFDLEVFEGARTLADIRLLQSEISVVPLYEGMPHYTESLRAYESAGFSLLDLFVVNRTSSGGILEYDCLMAREDA
jgi:FkbM family methyltransferase